MPPAAQDSTIETQDTLSTETQQQPLCQHAAHALITQHAPVNALITHHASPVCSQDLQHHGSHLGDCPHVDLHVSR